jgi:hypothetical protein
MRLNVLLFALAQVALWGQEADSGFELRTTLTEAGAYSQQLSEAPRSDGPLAGGFRALLYPTLKINSHWTVAGTLQVHSRPYFFEEFSTQGYGVRGDILQLHLSYARIWNKYSVVVRAGQLSSAFGSFLLHYDDADNPLIDLPPSYGYYSKGVSTGGLAGAQADVSLGRVDLRAQFVNSSPANRRSIFDRDQYGNWSGGAGYTIRQGLHVGASAYRGPYLDRQYPYYFPGEAKPRELPGSAYGLDGAWGRGHWNVTGEWQRFVMTYRAIPTFIHTMGYVDARRVLNPRMYAATRVSYTRASVGSGREIYEVAVGFRPNAHQLVKVGYQIQQGPEVRGTLGNTFAVQLVTSLRPISMTWN